MASAHRFGSNCHVSAKQIVPLRPGRTFSTSLVRKDKGTKEKLNNTAVIKWILAKVTQKGE